MMDDVYIVGVSIGGCGPSPRHIPRLRSLHSHCEGPPVDIAASFLLKDTVEDAIRVWRHSASPIDFKVVSMLLCFDS